MLEGIAICALATQCDVAYIFIRGEYHRQAKVLEQALKEVNLSDYWQPRGLDGKPAQPDRYRASAGAATPAGIGLALQSH